MRMPFWLRLLKATWQQRDCTNNYLRSSISVKMIRLLSLYYVEIWLFLCLFVVPLIVYLCRHRNIRRVNGSAINTGENESKIKKTHRKPVISLTLNAILLKLELRHEVELINESTGAFLQLCSLADLYVFAEVTSNEEEELVIRILKRLNAFEKGLQPHRVMFSSTSQGRASMVRQLQPLLHIDCDESVVKTLLGKVQQVVLVKFERENSLSQSHQNGFSSLQACTDVIAAISTVDSS